MFAYFMLVSKNLPDGSSVLSQSKSVILETEEDLKVKSIHLLDEGVPDEPGSVWEESHDDDVDVADACCDGVRPIQKRDAAQSAHGHGYSCTNAHVSNDSRTDRR